MARKKDYDPDNQYAVIVNWNGKDKSFQMQGEHVEENVRDLKNAGATNVRVLSDPDGSIDDSYAR